MLFPTLIVAGGTLMVHEMSATALEAADHVFGQRKYAVALKEYERTFKEAKAFGSSPA